ncbi:hypothetical protein HMPREF3037_03068 [Candidatus Stoquefichus sp. KLE1796]|nr:hypothetical protein HMPREF3037_03068 [Candidatus Stoquefichus sp. KLE1796]
MERAFLMRMLFSYTSYIQHDVKLDLERRGDYASIKKHTK